MTTTTLKKISEVLGISISTVSRALKNHPDIAERTKQKVSDLAKTLDYEPNANAIHLRTQNSKVFGIIVPSISNFFYDSFIASVEEESRTHGYSLIILQSGDDPEIEMNNLKLCRQNRISGLFACITPNTTDIHSFQKLNEFNTPVIFFDKVPAFESCNKVCLADTQAATIAAENIILKNKKNVLALFGNKNLSITKKRQEAFESTFKSKTPEIKIAIDHTHNGNEAYTATKKVLQQKTKPDTIFCMSDEILAGTMKAVQELNLHLPTDLSVIAMSNGYIPKLYFPEITYVETSGYKLGKLAFNRMMSCMAGSTFMQELTLDCGLIEGGSI